VCLNLKQEEEDQGDQGEQVGIQMPVQSCVEKEYEKEIQSHTSLVYRQRLGGHVAPPGLPI